MADGESHPCKILSISGLIINGDYQDCFCNKQCTVFSIYNSNLTFDAPMLRVSITTNGRTKIVHNNVNPKVHCILEILMN